MTPQAQAAFIPGDAKGLTLANYQYSINEGGSWQALTRRRNLAGDHPRVGQRSHDSRDAAASHQYRRAGAPPRLLSLPLPKGRFSRR